MGNMQEYENLTLSADRIMELAAENTALSDWGEGPFRLALQVLVDSIVHESRLAPEKVAAAQTRLVGHLSNRLRIVEDRKRFPEIAQQKIEKPLVILGLPRSGTTLLQALLAADPDARSPQHWELTHPSPPPQSETYRTDSRITQVQTQVDGMVKGNPEVVKRHPYAATLPEECGRLFDLEIMCQTFFAHFYVPTYRDWLLGEDFRPAYETHRRALQHYQVHYVADHWVLKSPKHLFSMEALLATYPDARLVWLHRDPAQNMVSLASYISPIRQAQRPESDPKLIGREWTAIQELAISRGLAARELMPDAERRICDVHYNDLMADPLREVKRIYAQFDMPLSNRGEEAMSSWLAQNPQDKFGRHRYAAEDFGLSVAGLRERFAHYIERFGIEPDRVE